MLRMTRSPAMPGPIGLQSSRSLDQATYVQHLSKTMNAAAAAHAGRRMYMKSNIKFTKMKNWICEICSIKFKKRTMDVLHIFDQVVCDKCYNKSKDKEFNEIQNYKVQYKIH